MTERLPLLSKKNFLCMMSPYSGFSGCLSRCVTSNVIPTMCVSQVMLYLQCVCVSQVMLYLQCVCVTSNVIPTMCVSQEMFYLQCVCHKKCYTYNVCVTRNVVPTAYYKYLLVFNCYI